MELKILIPIVLALILIAVIAAMYRRKRPQYIRQQYLLTKNEYLFYGSLKQAVQGMGLVICPKVRLGDLVTVPGKHDGYWKARYAQVAQKHIDFVLCAESGLRPVLLIELDDRSHQKKENAARDEVKNICCKEANITLLRFKSKSRYDAESIRAQIVKNLNF